MNELKLRTTIVGADDKPEVVMMTLDERVDYSRSGGVYGDVVNQAQTIREIEGLPDHVPLIDIIRALEHWRRENQTGPKQPCPFKRWYAQTTRDLPQSMRERVQ
jgi:hypothetical protein